MRSSVASFCFVCLLPLLGAASAHADEEQARKHFLDGKQAYQEGRYQAAITSFQAAAGLRPSPILDFNIGRCHEQLGNLDQAIAAYRRYLSAAGEAANRAEVQARVARLEAKLEERRRGRANDPYADLERSGAPPAAPTAAAPAPVTPAAASQPGPSLPSRTSTPAGPGGLAEPQHEAALAGAYRGPAGAGAAAAPPRPATPPPPRDQGPAYKQWWFWVAVVSGATLTGLLIATAVYAAGGGSSGSHSSALQIRF